MIEGALFDLGSTLIRFSGNWQSAIEEGHQRMLQSLLQDGLKLDAQRFNEVFAETWQAALIQRDIDCIERPFGELLIQVLAQLGHVQVSQAVIDQALRRMFSPGEACWQPMPGVYSVLEELRQRALRLAIVSNASDAANVHRLVDGANLRPYFDMIIISAEWGVRKPDKRIFDPVLQAWDLPPQRLVMTGDSLVADIEGARRAGMFSIWLTTDAETPENQAVQDQIRPDAVARELVEVPDIIHNRGGIHP